jgi:hypothetical protein
LLFAAQKKNVKKEHRKSDTLVVESLGPALFSTPDIIRRVGSIGEIKSVENLPVTSTAVIPSSIISNTSVCTSVISASTNTSVNSSSNFSATIPSISVTNMLESVETNINNNGTLNETITTKYNEDSILTESVENNKMIGKAVADLCCQPLMKSSKFVFIFKSRVFIYFVFF